MKTAVGLLLLSLAANVLLAVALGLRPGPARPPTPPQPSTAPAGTPAKPTADTTSSPLAPEFRAALASGDPARLAEALRQAGFPEDYVRAMVTSEIYARLRAKRLEVLRAEAEVPFWRRGSDPDLRERWSRVREIDREAQAEIREILGERVPLNYLEFARPRGDYRFLPPDKAAAVARIDGDYADIAMQANLEQPAGSRRGVLRLLDQERRADLAAVLSPAELELYDLHLSASAEVLRRQFAAFKPTEQEFRAMLAIRRAYDEETGDAVGTVGASISLAFSSEPSKLEAYRSVLSPERFAELTRSQHRDYRVAVAIAERFQLPADVPARVHALQEDFQRRMRAPELTGTTDREARTAALQALAQEANTALVSLLGDAGTSAYRQVAGSWLLALEANAGRSDAPGRPPTGG